MFSSTEPPPGTRSLPSASREAAPKTAARLPPPERATPSSRSPSGAGAMQDVLRPAARGNETGMADAHPVKSAHEQATTARRQRRLATVARGYPVAAGRAITILPPADKGSIRADDFPNRRAIQNKAGPGAGSSAGLRAGSTTSIASSRPRSGTGRLKVAALLPL